MTGHDSVNENFLKYIRPERTWKLHSPLPLFWVFISSIIRSIFGPSFYGRRFLQNWGTVQKRAKWWGRKAKTRSIGNPPPLSSRFPSSRARDQVSVNLLIIVDGFPNNSLILTEHGYNTQKMSAEEKIITLAPMWCHGYVLCSCLHCVHQRSFDPMMYNSFAPPSMMIDCWVNCDDTLEYLFLSLLSDIDMELNDAIKAETMKSNNIGLRMLQTTQIHAHSYPTVPTFTVWNPVNSDKVLYSVSQRV